MAKKKGPNEIASDVEASFFGDDDLDWLDDESEDASAEQVAEAERMPVAPPPPSPFVPSGQAGRFGAAPAPSGRPRRPPMPTLPPMPSGLPEEPAAVQPEAAFESGTALDAPTAESELTISDLPTQDDATLEVDPSSEEVRLKFPGDEAEAEVPSEPTAEVMFADNLDDQESVPMVRTQEPPPARAATVPPPSRRGARKNLANEPTFTPPVQPDPPRAEAPPPAAAVAVEEPPPIRMPPPPPPEPEAKAEPEREPEPEPEAEAPVAAATAFVGVPATRVASVPAAATPAPAPRSTPPAASLDEVLPAMNSLPPMPPMVERWTPRGDEEEWREAATTLVAEAAHVSGDAKARLMYEAGRIYRTRLGDRAGAEAMFQDALAAGLDTPEVRLELADAAGTHGDWPQAIEHLAARGALLSGSAASEALQHAAVVARQRTNQPEVVLAHLRKAVEADPDDYAAWSLVRDALVEGGNEVERVEVIGRIAMLSAGRLAADAWWEQGRVLQRLDRSADAEKAFERALGVDPAHMPSFLALEQVFQATRNDVALAGLYEREGAREGGVDGAWWQLRAARLYAASGQAKRADEAFAAAGTLVAAARREQQVWLERSGRFADLAAALEAEAASVTGAAQAHALYRLGLVRERHLDDAAGARAAFAAALEADGAATAAAEGVARLLRDSGSYEDHVQAGEAALAAAADDDARAAALVRLASLAEAKGDDARAAGAFAQLAEIGPAVFLPGLSGLARVQRRQGAWAELSATYERMAGGVEDAAVRSQLLFGATIAGPLPHDRTRSKELLGRALELSPLSRPALDAFVALLEEDGEWPGVIEALAKAASASADARERTALLYRAARVAADRIGDAERARALVDEVLTVESAFLPGLQLREQLASTAGASPESHRALREQAQAAEGAARAWTLIAAADVAAQVGLDVAADLRDALAVDPSNPAVLAAIEVHALTRDQGALLAEAYRRASGGARLERLVRLVELALAAGDAAQARAGLAQVQSLGGDALPLRYLARIAEGIQAWDVGAELLAASDRPEDRVHRARLLAHRLQDARGGVALYRELVDDPEWGVVAAAGAAGVAQRAGDLVMLVRSNAALSERLESKPLKSAYAGWTAGLLDSQDRPDEARKYWLIALDGRPWSPTAFEGARRALVACGDADALRDLYAKHRASDRIGLAEALEEVGDDAAAAVVWREATPEGAELPLLIRLERILARIEDWKGVYDAVTARRDRTRDEASKASIDAKRRWLLAEKLASTDEAWELYRSLHDDQPADREVTEALARIAGARGETALAVQYLRELADGAGSTEESARFQRRIAEAYEAVGDVPSARQAFFDALDHLPGDFDALNGLKRLAEQGEDWPALVGVLQREAGLVKGGRLLEVRREIARVTQQRLQDPGVAMDAWRAVLDIQAHDDEALTQLLELAAAQSEWQQFVETGMVLSAHSSGAERAALLRRIGVACQDELHRDDAVRFFEQAMTEIPPDDEAARRAEEIFRARGDWAGAVRALKIQAEITDDHAEKVDRIVTAAQLEAEVRHDRNAAALLYDRVLELEPTHEQALKFQAEHLFRGERTDAALPVYERLEPYMEKDQDLDDFDVRMELSSFYFKFAELLREQGRADDALARYDRALELNPAHLPSLEAVGPLYMRQEAWKKAEKVYRQLLQLTGGQGDPEKVASTYSDLGQVERALGHADKAHKRFAKALEVQPNHIGALKGMANILEDRKDWSNLLNVYNNIIYHAVSAEDVIHAYMTKGRILDEEMSRPDKAGQHYEGSLAIEGNQPVALLCLAELALRRQDWPEAIVQADKGVACDPSDGAVRGELLVARAIAQQGAGDPAAAGTSLAEAWKARPELADLVPDLEEVEKAATALRTRLPR